MRLRTALVALACGVVPLVAPRPAGATDCSGVLSPCINDDTLWPHAGPARFVAVGSTETVGRDRLGFGLVSTYLSRPVVLHVATPGGNGSDQNAVDNLANGTFLWAYGATDRLELDLALPLTYGQSGTGLAPITGGYGLNDTAARDLRFGFTYVLLARPRRARAGGGEAPDGVGLAGRFEVSAPSGDRSQFAGEGWAVFVPSIAAEYRLGRVFAGAEVGARIRPTAELLGARVGTQILTALGAGVDVLPRSLLSATLEAWALPTLDEQADVAVGGSTSGLYTTTPNGKHIVPAEWQLAARTAPLRGGDLSIQLGGGGALPLGDEAPVTRPRFRFTLGVRWAPSGPLGGPASAQPPVAAVEPAALHLASAPDRCKDEPDLVDGFRDDDGCPDEDQDKDGIDDRFDKCPLLAEDFAGLTDGCPEPPAGKTP
jgi:hypothetical protein